VLICLSLSDEEGEAEETVEKIEAENKEVEVEDKEVGGGGPPPVAPPEPADKEPVTAGGDVTNTLVSTGWSTLTFTYWL